MNDFGSRLGEYGPVQSIPRQLTFEAPQSPCGHTSTAVRTFAIGDRHAFRLRFAQTVVHGSGIDEQGSCCRPFRGYDGAFEHATAGLRPRLLTGAPTGADGD